MAARKKFLRAEWRKLAMINYVVDPELLTPYLPAHTELDFWNERSYVTLVGFRFSNTRVKGIKIPFHVNFEEVNLRFYVRYKGEEGWRRGVVFIKEIVPKYAVVRVANALFDERYERMPTSHLWDLSDEGLRVSYSWKKGDRNRIQLISDPTPREIDPDSEEAFIAEHYWGYSGIDEQRSSEYRVEHPSWQLYKVRDHSIDVDFGNCFGAEFAFLEDATPTSVFLAEGSEVNLGDRRVIEG